MPQASEGEDFLEEESPEGLHGLRNTLKWREQHQQGPGDDLRLGWKSEAGREERRREGLREASWAPWGLAGPPAAAL